MTAEEAMLRIAEIMRQYDAGERKHLSPSRTLGEIFGVVTIYQCYNPQAEQKPCTPTT